MDMDGVLYHGSQRLPHVLEFLQCFHTTPKIFITNNPLYSPREIVARLFAMGIVQIKPQQIINSAMVCQHYLQEHFEQIRFFNIGGGHLLELLSEIGQFDTENANLVVVGEGEGLDYQTLTIAINLIIKNGAKLICTNPDTTVDAHIDNHHRILPGGGALVAAIERACGQRAVYMGKPEPYLYQRALKLLDLEPSQCLMIGDRADTDIAGAARLGIATALVRTGRLLPQMALPDDLPPPDFDCDHLCDLACQLSTTVHCD